MATLSADDWIMAAVARLSVGGIDAVKVEPLASDLGVSKGSFYWHFDNRESLLAAMLIAWEARGTEAIIRELEREATSAPDKIHALIARTFGNPEYDGIELGVRAWARHDSAASAAVERVDTRRVRYVAGLIRASGIPAPEARARAQVMYRTLIGEFVMRSHGARPLPPATLRALGQSLLAKR